MRRSRAATARGGGAGRDARRLRGADRPVRGDEDHRRPRRSRATRSPRATASRPRRSSATASSAARPRSGRSCSRSPRPTPGPASRCGALQARIDQRCAERIDEGRKALARGVQVEARRKFLAALALDPSNRAAFDALPERHPRGGVPQPHRAGGGHAVEPGPALLRGPLAVGGDLGDQPAAAQSPPGARHHAEDPGDPRGAVRARGSAQAAAGGGRGAHPGRAAPRRPGSRAGSGPDGTRAEGGVHPRGEPAAGRGARGPRAQRLSRTRSAPWTSTSRASRGTARG